MSDRQARIDNALREAELARTQYFEGAVTDAEYVLKVMSLFLEVADDVTDKYRNAMMIEWVNEPTEELPQEQEWDEYCFSPRSNILPFVPRKKG